MTGAPSAWFSAPLSLRTIGSGVRLGQKHRGPVVGFAGFEAYNWTAMFLPKATPDPIVRKLNGALNQALDAPVIRERLAKLGAVIPGPERRTPEYLGAFVKSEVEKWAARSRPAARPWNSASRAQRSSAGTSPRVRGEVGLRSNPG